MYMFMLLNYNNDQKAYMQSNAMVLHKHKQGTSFSLQNALGIRKPLQTVKYYIEMTDR